MSIAVLALISCTGNAPCSLANPAGVALVFCLYLFIPDGHRVVQIIISCAAVDRNATAC
jgi:hypothetical protein